MNSIHCAYTGLLSTQQTGVRPNNLLDSLEMSEMATSMCRSTLEFRALDTPRPNLTKGYDDNAAVTPIISHLLSVI
jgi:hypothetical protein